MVSTVEMPKYARNIMSNDTTIAIGMDFFGVLHSSPTKQDVNGLFYFWGVVITSCSNTVKTYEAVKTSSCPFDDTAETVRCKTT